MESITKFLDPNSVPDEIGDDLDIEKELDKKSDLEDDSDTVVVNVSDKKKDTSIKNVTLPGQKETDSEESEKVDKTASKEVKDDSQTKSTADSEKAEEEPSGESEKGSEQKSDVEKDSAEESSGEKESDENDTVKSKNSEDEETKEKEENKEKEETKETDTTDDSEKSEEKKTDDSVKESETLDSGVESVETEQSDETDEESMGVSNDSPENDLSNEDNNVVPEPLLKQIEKYNFADTVVYELPNGAKIVLINKESELCHCQFEFNVGSFYEDDSNRGVSHLLEHLMFNACPGISALEFNRSLDKLGMHVNAFTDRKRTDFYCNGLKVNFISAFELYVRILNSFTLTEEILEKEKGVVINEIGVYADDNWTVLREAINSNAYRQHPIMHPILGYEDVIRNLNVDQVQSWYDTNYVAKNLTLYLAGKFEEEDLIFVANKLQSFRTGEQPNSIIITDAMTLPFVKNVVVYKDGIQQTHILSQIPIKNEGYNYYQLQMLSNVLGGSMSSYLWKAFREDRSIAYSVGAYCSNMDPEHFHLCCYAGLNNPDDGELAKTLFKEAFEWSKNIGEDEFNKGITIYTTDVYSGLEQLSGLVEFVEGAFYLGFDLDNYAVDFNKITYESYLNFVSEIDIDSVVTGILYPTEYQN